MKIPEIIKAVISVICFSLFVFSYTDENINNTVFWGIMVLICRDVIE
jgi:hypothetical protein